jgi:hypothetical protein
MSCATLVSAWDQLLFIFFPVFTQPTAQTFARLCAAWVLATGRHTITGIYGFVDPKEDRTHDTYHDFFHAAWSLIDLWRTWAIYVVSRFYPSGYVPIDLDDTLFHKSGRKVDGAGWWRDAVRSTCSKVVHVWGLNLVVLTVRIVAPWGGEPIGIPIHMRLHRKRGPSLIELAEAMVTDLAGWLPERAFTLCADGFYASLAGRDIPRTRLVSRMRRDAAIYALPAASRPGKRGRKPKKGPRLSTPQVMASHVRRWKAITVNERGRSRQRLVYSRVVLWYGVSHAPMRLVIVRDPEGREPDDFFFTTDLGMTEAQVIEAYAGRWSIEDTFRNTKQAVGGQEPQVWKEGGPERAAAFSLLLHGIVWVWYVHGGHRSAPLRVTPWYTHKERPSFQDAISALRRTLWRSRLFPKFGRRTAPAGIIETLLEAASRAA